MKRYEFHLHISPGQYLDYYRGVAKQVVVRCTTGQTIQFPAALLQKFVTSDGIRGHFSLTSDENNRHSDLQRLNT